MEDAEEETETEKQAGGAGRPKAHPSSAAASAAVGGPVTTETAPTKEEINNGAGYTPSHFTGAAPTTSVVGPVRAGLAPSIRNAQRKEGGDETPRSARAETDTADKATEESPPPNGCTHLTQAAEEGGKGEGEPPPSRARPWRAARERGGTPERTSGGTPYKGGHRTRKGTPTERMERGGPQQYRDEDPP